MALVTMNSQDIVKIINNNTTVTGSIGSGIEVVVIEPNITGTTVDVNVERVALHGSSSDYTYQQQSSNLIIYSGSTVVVTIPIQNDANGTQLTFTNGTVYVRIGQTGMTLGGVPVVSGTGSSTATQITPLSIDGWYTTATGVPVNNLPGGTVTITGNATVGSLITVTNTLTDTDGLGAFTYTWYAGATVVDSGTNTTYTTVSGDTGKSITCKISYTDGLGNSESKTSSPLGPISVPAGDTTPPVFQNAAISTNGLSLVLTYDETLSSTTATTSAFVVNVNSSPVTVNAVTAAGTAVTLTLAVAIQDGQTIAFTYTQPGGTDAIKDTAGNKAISLTSTSATNNSTVPGGGGSDVTPPVFQSAAISTNGLSLVLTYDETLSSTTATTSDFEVNVNSSPVTVNAVTASGSAVTLTLAVAIQDGQTVAISYTQPAGTDAIKDTAGNKAISLTSTSATNNSTVPAANTPPTGYLGINGDTSIGSTLTIDASGIADVDGLGVFSYSWSIGANSVDTVSIPFLPDPAASTLVIPATYRKFVGDIPRSTVGEQIRVIAYYTDGLGKNEYVGSGYGAIGLITPATGGGIPAVSPFRINGPSSSYLVHTGDLLTADTSMIADADGVGAFHYQWVEFYSSSYPPTNIGSDSATYTVSSFDDNIRCILTYTNGVGVLKTLLSNTLTNR